MKLLEGKVALITGAGRGIGKAMAQVFVKQGAKVVVGDIKKEWVTETADEINASFTRFRSFSSSGCVRSGKCCQGNSKLLWKNMASWTF